MNPPSTEAGGRSEYARRLAARRTSLSALDARHRNVGYARVVAAVTFLALSAALLFGGATFSAWWLFAPVVCLLLLGQRLDRLERSMAAISRAIRHYEHGLARIDGSWAGMGPAGTRFLDDHHMYGCDLDLFGNGSLFDLICSTRTTMGEDTLAGWFLRPSAPDVVRARQDGVRDLVPRLDFLERLASATADDQRGTGATSLTAWGTHALELQSRRWRMFVWFLSCAGGLAIPAIVLYIAGSSGVWDLDDGTLSMLRLYFLLVPLIVIAVRRRFKSQVDRILGQATSATFHLGLLEEVLRIIEAEAFQSAQLQALQATLLSNGPSPQASAHIARLRRLMVMVDMRRDRFLMRFVGPLLLFDFHLAWRVEDWRRVSGPSIAHWLTTVGEVEALASLATYCFCRPEHVFPEFVAGPEGWLEAEAIGHPLLHRRGNTDDGARPRVPPSDVVTNDVSIIPPLQTLIVSGSNMSGKSTLLRTLGINVVLAQAGGPVLAARMRLSPLAVGTSIRIQDSLQEGVSRFYAEILRLKQIMDAARDHPPLLFLVDEVLHGTNSHDRLLGTEAIVRGLVDRGAIGLMTTHDLALTGIAASLGSKASNVHFQDEIKDGRLHYDYIMRPGIVTRSNAIDLMRSIGLDV